MGNLINLNVAEVATECLAKANRLKAQAVSVSNYTNLEGLRTEANKEIKAIKAQIESAKKEYLKPFSEIEAQALTALAPYEEAAKEFGAKILEAKKAKRHQELKAFFDKEIAPNEDGVLPYEEIPSFDEIYQGIPTNASLIEAKETVSIRLRQAQKTKVYVELSGSRTMIDKLKQMAKAYGIDWEE